MTDEVRKKSEKLSHYSLKQQKRGSTFDIRSEMNEYVKLV